MDLVIRKNFINKIASLISQTLKKPIENIEFHEDGENLGACVSFNNFSLFMADKAEKFSICHAPTIGENCVDVLSHEIVIDLKKEFNLKFYKSKEAKMEDYYNQKIGTLFSVIEKNDWFTKIEEANDNFIIKLNNQEKADKLAQKFEHNNKIKFVDYKLEIDMFNLDEDKINKILDILT